MLTLTVALLTLIHAEPARISADNPGAVRFDAYETTIVQGMRADAFGRSPEDDQIVNCASATFGASPCVDGNHGPTSQDD
jgi:hypothetical protein